MHIFATRHKYKKMALLSRVIPSYGRDLVTLTKVDITYKPPTKVLHNTAAIFPKAIGRNHLVDIPKIIKLPTKNLMMSQ